MTSVEFLFQNLLECPKDKFIWYSYLDKAKQMHKKEIIDAVNQNEFNNIDGLGISETITKGEQYYQEKENLQDKKTLSEKYKEYKDWLNEIPELSDEIIFDFAKECALEDLITSIDSFVLGAKWYREQLKNK